MRKFMISLVLLLIAGGTVFYFGYVPFRIGKGNYGVVYTKTNGWNHPVIIPGEFHWFWQGVFPTNLKYFQISLSRRDTAVNLQGTLPSGETYSDYSETAEDFSYTVKASVSYTLDPHVLPDLLSSHKVETSVDFNAEALSLSDLYQRLDARIMSTADDSLQAILKKGVNYLSGGEYRQELEKALQTAVPELGDLEVIVKSFTFPDVDLYNSVRSNYIAYLNRNNELTLTAMQTASSVKAKELSRIEVLKEYGALLEEYPVLMDYYNTGASTGPLIVLPDTEQ